MDIKVIDTNQNTDDGGECVIDLEFVRKLATIQCTEEEVAVAIRMRLSDIYGDPNIGARFKQAYFEGINAGKLMIRQQQYKLVIKGDPRMIVFLSRMIFEIKSGEEDWPDVTSNVIEVDPAEGGAPRRKKKRDYED